METSHQGESRKKPVPDSRPMQENLPVPVERRSSDTPFGQAAFWRPRYMVASPVLGQVPFLFWLVEAARPRLIVQLGLGDGVGYLALCQVAERLNEGTIAIGIEAGQDRISQDFRAGHADLYGDASEILSPDHWSHRLPDGVGVDLLVLNCPLDQEGLASLHDAVLPRLSDNAVILVLDPETVLADPAVRQAVAGERQHRTMSVPAISGGIAVELFLHGAASTDELGIQAARLPGQRGWLALRQVFNRLGEGLVATRRNRDFSAEQEALQTRLQEAETAAQALRGEVEQASASENVQLQRYAELAASVHDLQKRASEATSENDMLKAEKDELARQVAELSAGQAHIQELREALEKARSEHDERIDDIAVLTVRYQADVKAADEAAKVATEAGKKAGKDIAALRHSLAKVTAHRDALLASTSWKITSPLRKVMQKVRRR